MESKIAVVAIGGNSLIKDNTRKTIPDQYQAVAETCAHITDMIAAGWEVVITHGNGPQVGFILRRSELAQHELHPVSLDYCGADTQGAIGYMIESALSNEFRKRGLEKEVAAVVTQVLVDHRDPAFQSPSKPIGSFMEEAVAQKHRGEDGWAVVEDAGRGWRRVVPSPLPVAILQQNAILELVKAGFVVVGVGGGGIPVVRDLEGDLIGVEAVIDKDFASSLLASGIEADLFVISTAVEKVALNFGKPDQAWLDEVTLEHARAYLAQGHFAKGSMEPKVKAIIEFLERGGREAIVTKPDCIGRALRRETGTRFMAA